jgi:hypothetical protein
MRRAIHALRQPASEKRQCTKSREVRHPAVQRVLWGSYVGGDLDGGRGASTRRRACAHAGEPGRVQWTSRRPLGAHQRAIGGLGDGIGSREIAAGAEPAHRNGRAATSTGGLAHDVSILLGVGRQLGSQPRANTSMTIMRAPQRGHGQGSTRGLSGATSGCCWGSARHFGEAWPWICYIECICAWHAPCGRSATPPISSPDRRPTGQKRAFGAFSICP